jgi:hypothetical protein
MSEVCREEISELEAVLSSKILTRAPNLARILNYICRERLEGRTSNIKEYNIAVYALGRSPQFDPSQDSIVRVEVTRLRKRLAQYYDNGGAGHAIQIRLPEAGYVPRFVRMEGDTVARAEADANTTKAQSELEDNVVAPASRLRALPFPASPKRKPILYFGIGVLVMICAASAVQLRKWFPAAASTTLSFAKERSTDPSSPVSGIARVGEIRIAAGSSASKYRDNLGRVWESDRYFDGGVAISKPDRQILRTFDPTLYRSAREGDFRYQIPLKFGVYELHLHFAEIVYEGSLDSSAESLRRFFVTLNGKQLLSDFDISLDAPGSNTADERVFKDVSPSEDGFLHLRFSSFQRKALLSGIEILPGIPGRMHPVRILAGPRTYYDRQERLWGPDRYFSGGHLWLPRLSPALGRTVDPDLYAGERFGNFQYFIPVAEGHYAVTVRFAESNFGGRDFGASSDRPGGVGSRLFTIFCNGAPIVKDLDMFKEGGGPNLALEKTFHSLKPNAQGKLVLSFVPTKDYACVRAIEVIDEGQ